LQPAATVCLFEFVIKHYLPDSLLDLTENAVNN